MASVFTEEQRAALEEASLDKYQEAVVKVRKLLQGVKNMKKDILIRRLTVKSRDWKKAVTAKGAYDYLDRMEKEGIVKSWFDLKKAERFYALK